MLLLTLLSAEACFSQKKKRQEESYSGLRFREAEFYFTEAEKFFILEDYSKALTYYERAAESNPENGTIHYKIAEVLSKSAKQEDILRATASIEKAIRLDSKNRFFYLLAANIYNSIGKFSDAAAMYERMLTEIPGTEDYLYEVAAVYQYAGKIPEAIKAYDRAEAALGVNELSSLQKMRLYFENDQITEGIAEGEKLINAYPDEDRYVMGLAEMLSQKGLRDKSISYLEKFIENNPTAHEAGMLLAGFYRETNQETKARPLLEKLFDSPASELSSKIIVIGSYNAELNESRVEGRADADKEAFAELLFQKLLATNSEDPTVHIVGGDLYLSMGRPRDAQKEYLIAAESGDVNFEVWENLLYLEIQLEQFDNVIKHSEEALELFPNHSMIHYFNGFAHVRKRQFEEGSFSLEQAKKLAGSNQALINDVNLLLGESYNALKQYQKSDEAFEEALAFNANNEMVLNNYSYFLAMRKENLEKAEKMSALLIKNHPENASFLDTHAWVLYVRGKYKDARKVIEKALATGNANATHFEHYGDILYQLGDVDGAVIQWEKARGLNANREVLNKKIANRKIYE